LCFEIQEESNKSRRHETPRSPLSSRSSQLRIRCFLLQKRHMIVVLN